MAVQWLSKFSATDSRRRSRRTRNMRALSLRVEALEDRTAPATLVAAYAFNEGTGTTVNDSSGNGNNGTITNATWTTSGKYGDALVFNGTNAR